MAGRITPGAGGGGSGEGVFQLGPQQNLFKGTNKAAAVAARDAYAVALSNLDWVEAYRNNRFKYVVALEDTTNATITFQTYAEDTTTYTTVFEKEYNSVTLPAKPSGVLYGFIRNGRKLHEFEVDSKADADTIAAAGKAAVAALDPWALYVDGRHFISQAVTAEEDRAYTSLWGKTFKGSDGSTDLTMPAKPTRANNDSVLLHDGVKKVRLQEGGGLNANNRTTAGVAVWNNVQSAITKPWKLHFTDSGGTARVLDVTNVEKVTIPGDSFYYYFTVAGISSVPAGSITSPDLQGNLPNGQWNVVIDIGPGTSIADTSSGNWDLRERDPSHSWFDVGTSTGVTQATMQQIANGRIDTLVEAFARVGNAARIPESKLDQGIIDQLSKGGPAGPKGEPGAAGVGTPGAKGEQGDAGPKGDSVKGEPGPAGPKGDPGSGSGGGAGSKGDKGDKGEPGADGVGTDGAKGDKGDAGNAGAKGDAGAGLKGDIGPAGEKGAKGDNTGTQGEKGAKGDKGSNAEIESFNGRYVASATVTVPETGNYGISDFVQEAGRQQGQETIQGKNLFVRLNRSTTEQGKVGYLFAIKDEGNQIVSESIWIMGQTDKLYGGFHLRRTSPSIIDKSAYLQIDSTYNSVDDGLYCTLTLNATPVNRDSGWPSTPVTYAIEVHSVVMGAGPKGSRGDQGDAVKGEPGATGPAGPKGDQGAGVKGATGPAGPKGDQGPSGGQKGDKGDTGGGGGSLVTNVTSSITYNADQALALDGEIIYCRNTTSISLSFPTPSGAGAVSFMLCNMSPNGASVTMQGTASHTLRLGALGDVAIATYDRGTSRWEWNKLPESDFIYANATWDAVHTRFSNGRRVVNLATSDVILTLGDAGANISLEVINASPTGNSVTVTTNPASLHDGDNVAVLGARDHAVLSFNNSTNKWVGRTLSGFVADAIAKLVDGAPADRNTLNEVNNAVAAIEARLRHRTGESFDGEDVTLSDASFPSGTDRYIFSVDLGTVVAGGHAHLRLYSGATPLVATNTFRVDRVVLLDSAPSTGPVATAAHLPNSALLLGITPAGKAVGRVARFVDSEGDTHIYMEVPRTDLPNGGYQLIVDALDIQAEAGLAETIPTFYQLPTLPLDDLPNVQGSRPGAYPNLKNAGRTSILDSSFVEITGARQWDASGRQPIVGWKFPTSDLAGLAKILPSVSRPALTSSLFLKDENAELLLSVDTEGSLKYTGRNVLRWKIWCTDI